MTHYLPYVDGLRALAVLSVVLYHLNAAWLPGGFAGVDVFFVISGFIVSASVASHQPQSLRQFMAWFYARRVQRIIPALVVCLLVTTLATVVLVPNAWLSDGIYRAGLAAFFGLSNWVLAHNGRDYFSPSAEFNPFTHTWSLGVEEQFYLVFPLVFYFWYRGGAGRRVAVGIFALLGAASLVYAARIGGKDQLTAFYMITARFWELAAGVLLYQFLARRGPVPATDSTGTRWSSALAWAALGLTLFGLGTANPARFSFPGAVPAVLGTVGLLGLLYGRSTRHPLVWLLTREAVLRVGRMSYSLYLWHWPVFVLFRWTVGLEGALHQGLALACAFGLAAVSYRLVERPVRQWDRLRTLPRFAVVAGGFTAVVAGAGLGTGMKAAQPVLSVSVVTQQAADWYPTGMGADPRWPGCTVGTEVKPLQHGSVTVYTRQNCSAPAPAPAAQRLFALGDSHATGYVPLFMQVVLETGAPLHLYGIGGCPVLGLRPELESAPHCRLGREAALAHLQSVLRPGDVVFLPSLRLPRFSDQWALFDEAQVRQVTFSDAGAAGRREAARTGLEFLRTIAATGARVVLEGPKPLFRAPPYRCAERYNQTNPICRPGTTIERDLLETFRAPVLDTFRDWAAAVPAVTVWDPFPLLCPPGQARCDAFLQGKPLFFDADHLSNHGNRFLVPSFVQMLRSLPASPTGTNRESAARPS
jgi:peptidoglycan/LPS O-acetylase OafA/YrhL